MEEPTTNWALTYISESGIVELVFRETVTRQAVRQATSEAINLARKQEVTDFLVDTSGVGIAPDMVSLLDLPDKQYDAEGLPRRSRIAVVRPISPEADRAAQFYETACINRGWNVRLFSSRDEAIKSLRESRTRNKPDARKRK